MTDNVIQVQVGDAVEVIGVQIPATSGAHKLDDLSDVEGADTASVGQVLAREIDGQWRPTTPTDGGGGPSGPQASLYTQASPSTVWLITHGLGFYPSGIEVRDHTGAPHYPVVTWPDDLSVRLDFVTSVRGTARLS